MPVRSNAEHLCRRWALLPVAMATAECSRVAVVRFVSMGRTADAFLCVGAHFVNLQREACEDVAALHTDQIREESLRCSSVMWGFVF